MATVLVTAGPTREHLDDVRFLSNESSGRMGFLIAGAAVARGHRALLVAGPTALPVPDGVECTRVISAEEMHAHSLRLFEASDVAFGAAAVCDHRPATRRPGKPAKDARPQVIELVPNPDVIAALAAHKGSRVVVGFALESRTDGGRDGVIARARGKLERKRLDLIVVNETDALGAVASEVTLLFADGRIESWPRQGKDVTASRLVECGVGLWAGRGGGMP